MKIPFLNRFTGSIICEIEIGDDVRAELRVKIALEKAVKNGANLTRANLYGANLDGANLDGANLTRANLTRANLDGANLTRANLDKDTRLPAFSHCPEEGAFVAWKKLKDGAIAKLEIPAKAKRASSLVGRKMRAEFVKTLAIWASDGTKIKSGLGQHDGKTKYVVGKITKPDSFDLDPRVECTHGIHFFITRKEAEQY